MEEFLIENIVLFLPIKNILTLTECNSIINNYINNMWEYIIIRDFNIKQLFYDFSIYKQLYILKNQWFFNDSDIKKHGIKLYELGEKYMNKIKKNNIGFYIKIKVHKIIHVKSLLFFLEKYDWFLFRTFSGTFEILNKEQISTKKTQYIIIYVKSILDNLFDFLVSNNIKYEVPNFSHEPNHIKYVNNLNSNMNNMKSYTNNVKYYFIKMRNKKIEQHVHENIMKYIYYNIKTLTIRL